MCRSVPPPVIPEMTGQPIITPDVISGGEKVIVSIPVTINTYHVAIRLINLEDDVVVMTYVDDVLGQSMVEIETPWVNANIGEMLYLEVYVIATDQDIYSHYDRDTSRSTDNYTIYQTDGTAYEYTGVTDITIPWLEITD